MRLLIVFSVMIFLFSGCYTQFVTMESALPSIQPTTMIDSTTGDTIKVIHQVDTIVSRDRETCVWVRDMFGHPYLQCYDSYYPRAWFSYSNTPWWYRNDPYWYDYNRCPRYYRYDPSCGRCRYDNDYYRYDNYYRGGGRHYDNRHYDNHSSSGSSSSSSGSSNGPTPSGGAPLTGSSSRTTAQRAPSTPPPTPSGGSPQKAVEPSPPPPQQSAPPSSSQSDQNHSKQRNIRSLRSR